MRITIIGTGYVGLVTAASYAQLGHKVFSVGRNINKLEKINKGISPFFEPGLSTLLKKHIKSGKLIATNNFEESIKDSEIIFIAVGTPTVGDKIDLSQIRNVSEQIGLVLRDSNKYHVIVVKSTVPPGTTEKVVRPIIEKYSSKTAGVDFGLCMNPEFLREGNALGDALKPDRVILGQLDKKSGQIFSQIYKTNKIPFVLTNLKTAELTKYASNALFATLISYSNEIARISEAEGGIDVLDVWKGVHLDKRLSPVLGGKRIEPGILSYILSGCGYGGSCFPKDTKALATYAKDIGINAEIIKSVISVNSTQPNRILTLLKKEIGSLKSKKIAVLGLSFKPNTDDIRESPAVVIINGLLKLGAKVAAHDPKAYNDFIPSEFKIPNLILVKKPTEALRDADGAILITSWEEYGNISPKIFKKLMKNPIVIDGRRFLDRYRFEKESVVYRGIGYSGNNN